MNQTTAHIITLWSAMLTKTEKGIERRLPQGCSVLQHRILLQLALPETACLRRSQLARALLARPADVQLALDVLQENELVAHRQNESTCGSPLGSCNDGQCRGCADGGFFITEQGHAFLKAVSAVVETFLQERRRYLSDQDECLLLGMYYDALVHPGSFFACRATSMVKGEELPPAYHMTVIAMLLQSIGATTKCVANLSLTDFRFLLELYPKRRGVQKRLRAKDIVYYLRVGKSYVATAANRLEERGLIERVPDEHDARGVLYQLTMAGERVVQDVGDDMEALFGGVFGMNNTESSRMIRAVKALLQGTEECFDRVDVNTVV